MYNNTSLVTGLKQCFEFILFQPRDSSERALPQQGRNKSAASDRSQTMPFTSNCFHNVTNLCIIPLSNESHSLLGVDNIIVLLSGAGWGGF